MYAHIKYDCFVLFPAIVICTSNRGYIVVLPEKQKRVALTETHLTNLKETQNNNNIMYASETASVTDKEDKEQVF